MENEMDGDKMKITDFIDEKLYEQFNRDIYGAFLKLNDPMTMILKGHLYIEAEFEKQLDIYLANPEVLDISRMKFPAKLNFLIALGIMDKSDRSPYAKLNEVRRKFAHDLNYQLQENDVQIIVDSFNKSQKSRFNKMADGQSSLMGKLRFCLSILWIDISLNTESIKLKAETQRLEEEIKKLNEKSTFDSPKQFEKYWENYMERISKQKDSQTEVMNDKVAPAGEDCN
ncbi:hypothetical protein LCY76_09365 [Fictibacillus sp. KIGAM418]|uniref:Uncharacterized protein n=1 Tax=Fictibacillus marinisediminis TaxID=2878389 RepID=A0A9X1X9P9_9BACL|nr:hypothetical protein [Fictibacillus marinisediminis]MCK6256802.1 hypothetical protein [Fictibacillus marinisediminis]